MIRPYKQLFVMPAWTLVVALMIAAQPVWSQATDPLASWVNLKQLAPDTEIRIAMADGRSLRGRLQSVTDKSLAVNSDKGQESLDRQSVLRVSTKGTGHRLRNTLLGLGIGAGVGLAVGGVADARSRPSWFPAWKAVATPTGAIVGAVVGALWRTGGWRDVYRTP